MADISKLTLTVKKEDGTTVTTTYDIKDKIAREQLNAIPDGTYPDMTVGGVMSSDGSTDSTPYLYRESGGGVEVGTVEGDSIVGGTVAWNQLVGKYTSGATNNGVTFTPNADGSVSVNGTASATAIQYVPNTGRVTAIVGHKYFACGCPSGGGADTWQLSIRVNNGGTIVGNDYGSGVLFAFTASTANNAFALLMRVVAGATINAKFIPQLFDLTQMFGSTIADYIYSLEQSSTGAGVAFFRKLFPKDYYEYNTGELMSVEGLQSHDMVGFNQWAEEWELGIYNISSGEKVSNTNAIRCKNPIPVLPNTSYFKHVGGEGACTYGCYYDEDGNFISRHSAQKNTIFVTPKNCYYMTFYCESSYGTTYNHDICINLSSDRNGEYEPYIKHSYPLDSSLTLRGIPKLSNGLYFDGDTYEADGTVTRKYGVVDLGTLRWDFDSTYNMFQTFSVLVKTGSEGTPIICDRYVARPYGYNSSYSTEDKITWVHSGSGTLRVRDSSYTDATAFKSAMSGVMLVYELATPTTESAEPYDSIQKVSKYGTEEYVSTGIVPVGHVTKYPTDIVAKVNGLPSDFSTLIAPTETGFKATRAYSVNQFLIVNNQLYRVTSAIANGATITVGTNVVATTVADILTQLLGV